MLPSDPVLDTADPRERVSRALVDPIYGSATDGELAELCEVPIGYVRKVRAYMTRSDAVRELLELASIQAHREGVGHMDPVTYLRILVRDIQRNATSNQRRDRAQEVALHQSRGPARRAGAGPSSPSVPTAKERRIGQPADRAGRHAGGETLRAGDRDSARDRARRCNAPPPGVRQRPDPVASG